MKKPRITDFDPDAKIPTLKSSLDNMPAIEKPKTSIKQPAPVQSATSDKTPKEPLFIPTDTPRPSSPIQEEKRLFIKRTFDIYQDQLSYLTRESLQGRLEGKEASMNAMVREAIDDWIKKRTAKK